MSREPDEGFVPAIYRWASTGDLTAALLATDDSGTGISAGISCAGAGRCWTCWTRCAKRPANLSCEPPPSRRSTTSGAASSQLTPGRLARSYGYIR
ncbi:putative helicase helY domain protein [Mycobacterium xenopi 3993]|nr:putative helicase helY domain protein [Mycobacterium xenopi 3993]